MKVNIKQIINLKKALKLMYERHRAVKFVIHCFSECRAVDRNEIEELNKTIGNIQSYVYYNCDDIIIDKITKIIEGVE